MAGSMPLASRVTSGLLLLLGALAATAVTQPVPDAPPCCLGIGPQCNVVLNYTCAVPPQNAGESQLFSVSATDPANAVCSNAYLFVEVWDMTALTNSSAPVGDLLVFMAKGQTPSAEWFAEQGSWTYVPPKTTTTDLREIREPANATYSAEISWFLQRPYHSVQAPFGSDATAWQIVLLHPKQWQQLPVSGLQMRVSCVPNKQADGGCPAAEASQVACNGTGTCGWSPAAPYVPMCYCGNEFPNTGGYSCTDTVFPIERFPLGAWFNPLAQLPVPGHALPTGQWLHMSFELSQVPALARNASVLMVELLRSRGKLLLIMKREGEGYEPFGLPDLMDINSGFADTDSYFEFRNQHFRYDQLSPTDLKEGTKFYISVLNTDFVEPIPAENAQFNLRVSLITTETLAAALTLNGPPCPFNCTSNGDCVVAQTPTFSLTCACAPGWAGQLCDGSLQPIELGQQVGGLLPPGGWNYFQLNFTKDPNAATNGLIVQLNAGSSSSNTNDGHAVLVAAVDEVIPTLQRNQWALTSRQQSTFTTMARSIGFSSMDSPILTLGLTNLDYFTHGDLQYGLVIVTPPSSSFTISPWVTVGAVFGGVVLLCFCLCVYRAVRSMHVSQPVDVEHVRLARQQGCPASLIDTFELFDYDPDKHGALFTDTSTRELSTPVSSLERVSAKDDHSHPSCSVCLIDYAAGDALRRLPCQHCFHRGCIDEWLGRHVTCPICRTVLVATPARSFTSAPSALDSAASVGGLSAATPQPGRTLSQLCTSGALQNASDMSGASAPRDGDDLFSARSTLQTSLEMSSALSLTSPPECAPGLQPVAETDSRGRLPRWRPADSKHAQRKSPASTDDSAPGSRSFSAGSPRRDGDGVGGARVLAEQHAVGRAPMRTCSDDEGDGAAGIDDVVVDVVPDAKR